MDQINDALPYITGLVLLLPGIIVLGFRAAIEGRAERGDSAPADGAGAKKAADLNSHLIPVCLICWLATFLALGVISLATGSTTLSILDSDLEFRPFVPFFGLLGAMVFVMDLFRGKKTLDIGTEFAMRLVLGPYVAIVMVVLFEDNIRFVDLSGPKAQAALAFLSGFLVVLFLQGVTERGNELLGRWREGARYQPSEIAKKFGLDMRDDQRLRQDANLKYLGQLRTLPDAALKEKGKDAGLGEGLLVEFKRQLEAERLEGMLGAEAWEKLGTEGLKSAKDVAALTPQRLSEIADRQSLSRELLERVHDAYRELAAAWIRPSSA